MRVLEERIVEHDVGKAFLKMTPSILTPAFSCGVRIKQRSPRVRSQKRVKRQKQRSKTKALSEPQ